MKSFQCAKELNRWLHLHNMKHPKFPGDAISRCSPCVISMKEKTILRINHLTALRLLTWPKTFYNQNCLLSLCVSFSPPFHVSSCRLSSHISLNAFLETVTNVYLRRWLDTVDENRSKIETDLHLRLLIDNRTFRLTHVFGANVSFNYTRIRWARLGNSRVIACRKVSGKILAIKRRKLRLRGRESGIKITIKLLSFNHHRGKDVNVNDVELFNCSWIVSVST